MPKTTDFARAPYELMRKDRFDALYEHAIKLEALLRRAMELDGQEDRTPSRWAVEAESYLND